MTRTVLIIVSSFLLLLACEKETTLQGSADTSANFSQMLKDYYEEGLKLDPINATFQGDSRYNDQFPNTLSKEYRDQKRAYYSKYLEALNQFKEEDLKESERMSKATLKWECDINLEELEFRTDLFPIDQMWSVNLIVGQLASGASAQPFRTVEDYQAWLKRLEAYLVWLDTAGERMKEGIESGYVLPKSLIVKVVPQLKALANENIEEHLFYSPIKNLPEEISDVDKEMLKTAYKEIISEKVIPSYKKLHDFMSSEYLAAGRTTSGVDAVPNGKAYYEHQIKKYTTTSMTADEIHELGLKEVGRIRAEMEKVKAEVGFKGDLLAFFDHVRTNQELMPFDDPQEVLDNFNAIHERMKPQLEQLFDLKPKAAFEVRRTEAFREKSASAEYNPGSLDGSRPGVFYTPIPDVKTYNTYSDESLFLHEAIPGHHYQVSLTQENEALPQFRRTLWYSAYGEGWALYTESLGRELGLYTDPYQYFGMLGAEIHRAIRLVVDSGIHAKGWTREKAIQYCLENEAESEASIISEIERYMANGGQALSYKIGQLKIRELRRKAEETLGDKFDIRQFHNQVLETGCVPLAILEDKINGWISANAKAIAD